jgi:hypothetical protein
MINNHNITDYTLSKAYQIKIEEECSNRTEKLSILAYTLKNGKWALTYSFGKKLNQPVPTDTVTRVINAHMSNYDACKMDYTVTVMSDKDEIWFFIFGESGHRSKVME